SAAPRSSSGRSATAGTRPSGCIGISRRAPRPPSRRPRLRSSQSGSPRRHKDTKGGTKGALCLAMPCSPALLRAFVSLWFKRCSPAGRVMTFADEFRANAAHLAAHGLYDPAEEHDACGVGFVAAIDGKPRRSVVEAAINAL